MLFPLICFISLCASACSPKHVDMIAFLDCSVTKALSGSCARSLTDRALDRANQVFAASNTECTVNLRLLAIFTWGCQCDTNAMPASLVYNRDGSGNVNYVRLHGSFRDWHTASRPTIEAALGRSYDLAFLMTAEKLVDNVIGYADLDRMCTTGAFVASLSIPLTTQDLAVSCLEPAGVSLTGNLIAHELAHTLGCRHEGASAGCPNVVSSSPSVPIMCPMISSSPDAVFSASSEAQLNSWFTNKYGSSQPACLDVSEGGVGADVDDGLGWEDRAVCGDGVVNGCEECDPGLGVDDPCCDEARCRLEPGCACASCSHACCLAGGVVASADTVCRPSADDSPLSDCDTPELCDGSSPYCPVDLRAKTGSACAANRGRCYSGDCRVGWPRVTKTSFLWVAEPCDVRFNSSHITCRDADSGEPAADNTACDGQPRPDLTCCNPPLPFDPTVQLAGGVRATVDLWCCIATLWLGIVIV